MREFEDVSRMGKVSIETRERLLEALGSPQGVTIARLKAGSVDVISVQMPSRSSIRSEARPEQFEGFRVEYCLSMPGHAGAILS